MRISLAAIITFAFVTASCAASGSKSGAISVADASPEAARITATPTAVRRRPTRTARPATPTAPVDPECVPQAEHEPLAQAEFAALPQAMLDFLNAGGQMEQLAAALDERGLANLPRPTASGDLTGDGRAEVVVSILDPQSQNSPQGGVLLVYLCQGGSYVLAHTESSQETFGAPSITQIQDLNADGAGELIFSSESFGAHSRFEAAQILAWNGQKFEPRLDGETLDLPNPRAQLTDYDQDGVYNLEITGGGFSSVGAGPQRSLTRVWEYDSESGHWLPTEENPGPSDYRIHVLQDAEAAARRGEYLVASLLYEQVIDSDELKDWVDPESERLNLGAYAQFKLVVVFSMMGEEENAAGTLAEMRELYPVQMSQHAYVEMAEAFLEGFGTGGQEAACTAAQDYAASHAGLVLAPLGSQTFGYGNPDFTPADVCP